MTTGAVIHDAIQKIASTSSTKEKQTLVAKAGTELFQKAMRYAYDPFKNYGISVAPEQTMVGGDCLSSPLVWTLLDSLAVRKLTGSSAKQAIQGMINSLDPKSAVVFQRILNKDMRAGFGETVLGKCFKGLLPEFPYMRCSLPKKSNMATWDWSNGIFVQLKADGMFANVNRDEEGFTWVTSRNGSLFPPNCLQLDFSALDHGTQTHGELVVYNFGKLLPRKTSNGILNSLLSGGELPEGHTVVYQAWDQIPLSSVTPKGKHPVVYRLRFEMLQHQIEGSLSSLASIPSKRVWTMAEALKIYQDYLKEGMEGVICKHPDMPWIDTGSSGHKDQVKFKLEFQVELRVVGLNPGKPGTKTEATFGSLLCQSECGKLEVGVSGLSDADRARGKEWVGSIVTVTANDIMTPDGGVNPLHSLFLPRLEEERKDKTVANTLEEIFATKEGAMA